MPWLVDALDPRCCLTSYRGVRGTRLRAWLIGHDALAAGHVERIADIEYVRILHLAASTSQADVEAALGATLDAGGTLDVDTSRALVRPRHSMPPLLSIPAPDITSYDALISGVAQ